MILFDCKTFKKHKIALDILNHNDILIKKLYKH
jgi:hypothetical protein